MLGQALAGLEPGLLLGGGPVIRPRYRRVADKIWVADLEPDLTHLREIDPDDAKTRCSFVVGHFPAGVTGVVVPWWLCVISGMIAGCDRCAAR